MAYPSTIDSFTNPVGTTQLSADDHAQQHRIEGSAAVALENKVGIGSGSAAANQILVGSGAGTSAWGSVWNLAQLGTATINNATVGTPRITGGTASAFLLGTSTLTAGTINGQIVNAGTLANGVYGTAQFTGGTLANAAVGTPTILGGTIAGSGTAAAISFGIAIAPNAGSLTDSAGGTFTVNAATAQVYFSVMGTNAGNRTLNTPANPTSWQPINYAYKASGSNNATLVWGTAFQISQDVGTPALGTSTSWNYFSWRYNPISTKWDFQGNSLNLI